MPTSGTSAHDAQLDYFRIADDTQDRPGVVQVSNEHAWPPRLNGGRCMGNLSTTRFRVVIKPRANLHFRTYFMPSSTSYCRITP
jgi:hypothetical protein